MEPFVTQPQVDLSKEEVGKIVSFLGYGSPSAPVWFVGFEEGLGDMDDQDTAFNLKARSQFAKTMDLRQAHSNLREKGKPIDFDKKYKFTQVWLYMAKIMRGYSGYRDWSDLDLAKTYIRRHLGRFDGETFLTELSPIPAKDEAKAKDWMAAFKKTEPDVEQKIEQRTRELKQILSQTLPPLVICYGSRADDFARLLGVTWQRVSLADTHKQKVHAAADHTRILLPFFGNGAISHSLIEDVLRSGLIRRP